MSLPRSSLLAFVLLASACAGSADGDLPPAWERLATEPANDRQDDVCFIDADNGWYVNSLGKIFKTVDGGSTWKEQVHLPGTYWRAVTFIDKWRGFAGNLGPGAIEGFRTVMAPEDFKNLNAKVKITDPNLIYETTNGGWTWTPLRDHHEIGGGICTMSTFRDSEGRATVYAGGRVTGPPRAVPLDQGAAGLQSQNRTAEWCSMSCS
jgi:hypothetical protein